jgi:hypothetical protein
MVNDAHGMLPISYGSLHCFKASFTSLTIISLVWSSADALTILTRLRLRKWIAMVYWIMIMMRGALKAIASLFLHCPDHFFTRRVLC